jgi:predicted small secreted protein
MKERYMVRKLVTVGFAGFALAVAGCNTVRGAAADVNSAANCTEDVMKQGQC